MTTNEFFKLYPYAVTSPNFAESLINKDADELEFIFSMFAFYVDQIETLNKKHTVESIFLSFMNNENSMPPVNAACKKGCSFCCNVYVSITKPEAEIILDYCKKNNIKIDYDYLKKQSELTQNNFHLSDARACVFLKNNQCSIYNVRPFACRNYFAISKPEFCDAVKYPNKRVLNLLDNEREIIRAALLTCLHKTAKHFYQNSIARALIDFR